MAVQHLPIERITSTDNAARNTEPPWTSTHSDGQNFNSAHRGRGPQPKLFHKVKNQRSILALVISDSKIYAGTQGGEILVWSLNTYELLSTISAHAGSVLSLFVSPNKKFLFSSAGDAIVNVWCTSSFSRLYSLFSTYDVGDIFCVVYSASLQSVYLGAQNTSIQWYDLSQKDVQPQPDLTLHPSQRNHRFFDSKGPGGVTTPRPSTIEETQAQGGQILNIDKDHIVQYAHFGYVYCMLIFIEASGDDEILVSGGGDGTIKLWSLDADAGGAITNPVSLENGDDSILTLALEGTILYSGRLDGEINVWDLDTRQLIRRVKPDNADILTLSLGHGLIFSGGANGLARKFNSRYERISEWQAHERLILASAIATVNGKRLYATGGNDDCVAIWDVGDCVQAPTVKSTSSNEELLESLRQFVSYRTVSSMSAYAEDCRRGASWLRGLFKRFGADTEMLNTEDSRNPVVFARFHGRNSKTQKGKKILFYGHYDVVAAENRKKTWNTEPFELHGINGYYYGRGVSDNKGPILAAIYAVADLVTKQQLDSDVLFLIEGEEECGSTGFEVAVQKNKHIIGEVDWILLANSYWLDDEFPCLTYGLRGVVHVTVHVESERPDLHSGVDGSYLLNEALKDLVTLIATLTGPAGEVQIPGFYDAVLDTTAEENDRYDAISRTLLQHNPELGDAQGLTKSFKARWSQPSLTVHHIGSSGPATSSIIPRSATAALSMRLVPNQSAVQIKAALRTYLHKAFDKLNSSNHLHVEVNRIAEPWLGDPHNQIFQTLDEAIVEAWGSHSHRRRSSTSMKPMSKLVGAMTKVKASPATSSTLANGSDHTQTATAAVANDHVISPLQQYFPCQTSPGPLYIREGGSIPAIRFLEKEFNAPAAHLPCGQASDSAHLDNERLRLSNLYKSREIFRKVFRELPSK